MTCTSHCVNVINRSLSICNRTSSIICQRNTSFCTQPRDVTNQHQDSFRLSHVNPWTSLQNFSKSLVENILYQSDGLIMINKPYGVGTLPPSLAKKAEKAVFYRSQVSSCEYTLSESLPYLAESLGYKNLTVIKAPEKFNSGVAILSSSDEVTRKVLLSQKRSKPLQKIAQCYWAVVIGVPNQKNGANKFGLTLKTVKGTNKKYPVLMTEWSKRAVERGEVKPANVIHRTLCEATNRLASLVEIQPSTTKWHFIRVFLSHLLSPVLGDHLYGSRVADILGVPVLIDPASDNAAMPQKLSTNLLTALLLQSGQETIVPTHIHLRSQVLIGYSNGEDLTVEAPLPDSFQDSCQKLGLVLPT